MRAANFPCNLSRFQWSRPHADVIMRIEGLEYHTSWGRREEWEKAGDYCHGAKVGGVAASAMGEWRSVRTVAQQSPGSDAGGRVKSKSSKEGSAKAQSRVSVTASIAWPTSIGMMEIKVDNQVAAPAVNENAQLAPSE